MKSEFENKIKSNHSTFVVLIFDFQNFRFVKFEKFPNANLPPKLPIFGASFINFPIETISRHLNFENSKNLQSRKFQKLSIRKILRNFNSKNSKQI